MVQVRVAGIALDAAEQHVVLLRPIDALPGEGRILPIWIGAQEATSILIAIERAPVPRPLAHDLMRSLLDALNARVERIEITRIDDGTFFAEIAVHAGGGMHVIDARPSDAIALAARADAPMWVADVVMAEAGIADIPENDVDAVDDSTADEAADAETPVDRNLDEFLKFLEHVDPDDFRE